LTETIVYNANILFVDSVLFGQVRWAVFVGRCAVEIFFWQGWLSP